MERPEHFTEQQENNLKQWEKEGIHGEQLGYYFGFHYPKIPRPHVAEVFDFYFWMKKEI